GAGARVARPWSGRHHSIWGVDLVHADEVLRHHAHLLGHPAAIFQDIGGIVVRTEAAVEALVDFAGYAALAGEEGMAQAGNGREQRRSEGHWVSRSGAGG